MSNTNYPPPVDKLLDYGDPFVVDKWPDCVALGITAEHIPELIRMVTDTTLHDADFDSLAVWAPLHAWRVLGELHAEEAVEPLLSLLWRIDERDDDWVAEDLPEVLGMIGPGAIGALTEYAEDESHGLFARAAAARALETIANKNPETRDECIRILTGQLESFEHNDPTYNGMVIELLVDLKAVESAGVIEQAFESECVDLICAGDWEDVQFELGLKSERTAPRRRSPLTNSQHSPATFGRSTLEMRLLANRTRGKKRRGKQKSRQRKIHN